MAREVCLLLDDVAVRVVPPLAVSSPVNRIKGLKSSTCPVSSSIGLHMDMIATDVS